MKDNTQPSHERDVAIAHIDLRSRSEQYREPEWLKKLRTQQAEDQSRQQ